MNASHAPFPWSDAWLLLAAGVASKNGSSTLVGVIGAADMIQHAIMTKPELDGAIGRLQHAGLLIWSPPILIITQAGDALLKRTEHAAGSLLARQKYLEEQLAVEAQTEALTSAETDRDEVEVITSSDYTNALRAYEAESAKVSRRSRQRPPDGA